MKDMTQKEAEDLKRRIKEREAQLEALKDIMPFVQKYGEPTILEGCIDVRLLDMYFSQQGISNVSFSSGFYKRTKVQFIKMYWQNNRDFRREEVFFARMKNNAWKVDACLKSKDFSDIFNSILKAKKQWMRDVIAQRAAEKANAQNEKRARAERAKSKKEADELICRAIRLGVE